MMKRLILLTFFLLALTWAPRAQAGDTTIWAKQMYPGSGFTSDCIEKTPIQKCCTSAAGASCNEDSCETATDCTHSPYSTCTTLMGDSGLRCCAALGCASMESPERLCTGNGDCTNGSYPVCDFKWVEGTELPGPRWECTDTNSPSLFMLTKFPEELNNGSNQISCNVDWNNKGTTGNFAVNFRAVAINSATSAAVPGLTGGNFPQVVDASPSAPYRRAVSALSSAFCVEDESTGACCSGSACKGKLMKIEVKVDATNTTLAYPGRIRKIRCNYL